MDVLERLALRAAARAAVDLIVDGEPDRLVVLMLDCPPIPGEQGDDGVRCATPEEVLDHLITVAREGR